MNKNKIIATIAVIIFGAGMFFAGTRWEAKKLTTQFEKDKAALQENQRPQNPNQSNPSVAVGEITAKDDVSFMVKLQDGSEKKIIFSDETTVRKTEVVKALDLNVGQLVTVSGKSNEDGTLQAQNVSVRPAVQEIKKAQ